MKINHLNKGQITDLCCPFRYIQKRIKGKAIPSSSYAGDKGNLVHKTLQGFFATKKQRNKDRLLRLYRENYKHHYIPDEDFQDGKEMLVKWFRDNYDPKPKILGLEVQMGYNPFDNSGSPFLIGKSPILGFIDKVEEVDSNTCRVVDYKTSFLPDTQTKIESSLNPEVCIYLIGAMRLFPGYQKYIFQYDYTRHNKVETMRSEEELEDFEDYVSAVFEYGCSIDDEDPETNPGPHCTYCPVVGECPYITKMMKHSDGLFQDIIFKKKDLDNILDRYQIVSALAGIFYGKKKKIEEWLRVSILEGGDGVDTPRYTVQLKSSSRRRVKNMPIFYSLFKQYPMELFKIANFKVKDIEKILKNKKIDSHTREMIAQNGLERVEKNPKLNIEKKKMVDVEEEGY